MSAFGLSTGTLTGMSGILILMAVEVFQSVYVLRAGRPERFAKFHAACSKSERLPQRDIQRRIHSSLLIGHNFGWWAHPEVSSLRDTPQVIPSVNLSRLPFIHEPSPFDCPASVNIDAAGRPSEAGPVGRSRTTGHQPSITVPFLDPERPATANTR